MLTQNQYTPVAKDVITREFVAGGAYRCLHSSSSHFVKGDVYEAVYVGPMVQKPNTQGLPVPHTVLIGRRGRGFNTMHPVTGSKFEFVGMSNRFTDVTTKGPLG